MSDPADQRLFVYGELCKPAVLMAQLGRVPAAVPAVLDGYRRSRSSDTGYYRAEPRSGARLPGLLLCGLEAVELERLDEYENVAGGEYRRETVQVVPLVAAAPPTGAGPASGARRATSPTSREGEPRGRAVPDDAEETLPAGEAWIYLGG